MPKRLPAAVLMFSVAACTSIDPGTVQRDRVDYASAIGDSWREQTLLDIVKLRYGDVPIFLDVTQVVAGYQLQSTIAGGFTAGNFAGSLIGPFAVSGNAAGTGTYTDRPTVIYSPLIGVDFLKNLMTPIPPSNVLFLLQSGYSADRLMPMLISSINGINNEASSGLLQRPADPQFARLVELVREVQLASGLQIRIEQSKDRGETSLIVFGPSKDPQVAAKAQEIRRILELKQGIREFKVYYGAYSGKDNEIDMITRSALQIMIELARTMQVPEADVAQGKATPGLVDTPAGEIPNSTTMMMVLRAVTG